MLFTDVGINSTEEKSLFHSVRISRLRVAFYPLSSTLVNVERPELGAVEIFRWPASEPIRRRLRPDENCSYYATSRTNRGRMYNLASQYVSFRGTTYRGH